MIDNGQKLALINSLTAADGCASRSAVCDLASRAVPRIVPCCPVVHGRGRHSTTRTSREWPRQRYCTGPDGSRGEQLSRAHNPKVGGSNPPPATIEVQVRAGALAPALVLAGRSSTGRVDLYRRVAAPRVSAALSASRSRAKQSSGWCHVPDRRICRGRSAKLRSQ
jgi:hypothetical protein